MCIASVVRLTVNPRYGMPQDSDMLVVVTDAADENFVKRTGEKFVQVEVPFAPGDDMIFASYDACNNRVHDLVGFQKLFLRRFGLSGSTILG